MPFKRLLFIALAFFINASFSACNGHLVNPITDICWRCLFPLSIGNATVVKGKLPDTKNAKNPLGVCETPVGFRVGLNIGYWEPHALVDVTDTPYCLVNLGGHQLNLGQKRKRGGEANNAEGEAHAFFHAHWYHYPLISWLNIIINTGCMQTGDFDIAYLTELDPLWSDSEMSFVLNPEAAIFGNVAAQAACSFDSISSTVNNQSIDKLFWCVGSQGSHYPLTGHINAALSPVQTALLTAERLNYKLHRELLITDSSPKKGEICTPHRYPIIPKSRYRYEMVNQIADGSNCYPTGVSTLLWEKGKIEALKSRQYGFLVWRKRNCTFM